MDHSPRTRLAANIGVPLLKDVAQLRANVALSHTVR